MNPTDLSWGSRLDLYRGQPSGIRPGTWPSYGYTSAGMRGRLTPQFNVPGLPTNSHYVPRMGYGYGALPWTRIR